MNVLQDSHGRRFSYLRLSLTDACNFRCQYCLPNGYLARERTGDPLRDTVLSGSEIENLVRGFAELGFAKVRLTGGEPTLRPDIIEIVRRIKQVPGIQTVALTTNGYRLEKIAEPLREAGLDAINISLDSLDEERFRQITGSGQFERVLSGVREVLRLGFERVKINVVLLRSFITADLPIYLEWVRSVPVTIRFIELMETGGNRDFYQAEYLSGEELRREIEAAGWVAQARGPFDGPAHEFTRPEFCGRLGIIAPYTKDFCSGCNRLRVSSRGELKLCLFGDGEYSLRHLVQREEERKELIETIRTLITNKAPTHLLHKGIFGNTQHLAAIGG